MAHRSEGGFLDRAYDLEGPDATRRLYRNWAASYDAELRANGYASPARCAEALARFAEDRQAPLLDIGCGTGLSGEAFRAAGFATIDGTDFSAEMLAEAKRKAGIYRRLVQGDVNDPLPARPGAYANAAAVGVFSPGHAPPDVIGQVVELLDPGGCFVFTLNDHALEAAAYDEAIRAEADAGRAEPVFREYGPHVPGRRLKADVCVLRRR